MSPIKKILSGLGVVVIAVIISVVITGHMVSNTKPLGAGDTVEAYPSIWSNGIQIGVNAPITNNVWSGTCTTATIAAGTTLTASSSVPFTCNIPNIPAGANALVWFNNPLAAAQGITWGNIEVGNASTTAGVLRFYITKYLGTATSSIPNATSSIKYLIVN